MKIAPVQRRRKESAMLIMKYLGLKTEYEVNFSRVSENIVQLIGDMPEKEKGFTLSRKEKEDAWDYSDFTTVYRKIENGIQFSNDGSVYVAPPEPEPEPEPEPYVPTLEEVKEYKKQEIMSTYQMVKTAGFDIELSTGTEHFPLTDEDTTFLFGKQLELQASTEEKISYQNSDNRCKMYSREDMQLIINKALLFVNFQTTYRNNLCEWINACSEKEQVENISYGIAIPEEYQNEVYKKYLTQMEGAA